MAIGKPWVIIASVLIFISLTMFGMRLPNLNKPTKPRPNTKALFEAPTETLKILESSPVPAQSSPDPTACDLYDALQASLPRFFVSISTPLTSKPLKKLILCSLLPSRASPIA